MTNEIESPQFILKRAIEEWCNAQVLFNCPTWRGQPVARHLVEQLRHHPEIDEELIMLLSHKCQLVVAYSLVTLDMMDSPAVGNLPVELLARTEKITEVTGSFREKMELGAFARRTERFWRQRHPLK